MFDFSVPVSRHGTWCTQWDYVADRFGVEDLLPFTISDMDFATAPCVLQALHKRLEHGVLGYSRWKNTDFLSAIADWYQQRFNWQPDTETLVYAPSVIYLAATLIRQWSAPGDSVLIHTPAYDAFYKAITSNQRQVLSQPLRQTTSGWQCDMQALEQHLARPDCKIMLLCSPHNPTGKVWSLEELTTMSQLCDKHGVRVISDEIHMDMVWGEHRHIPWGRVASGDWALLTSASKSFNIPALTGAYGFIAHQDSRDNYLQALKAQDALSSPSVLALVAHIAAYREGASWFDALHRYLEDNLHYVAERLNRAFPQLHWQPPQSTYLAWIDIRPLGLDDDQLQQVLIHEFRVAIMPGSTYGAEGEGFLRLNVGCPRSKLEEGVSRLIGAMTALQSRAGA